MFTPALKAMFADEYLNLEIQRIKKRRAKKVEARKLEKVQNAIQNG